MQPKLHFSVHKWDSALPYLNIPHLQNFFHVPSNRAEMLEVVFERLALPLLFLDVSYVVTLK